MNVIKKFAAVVALGLVSFGSFAAQDMGTVQVSGAETLSAFEAQVAAKAEAAGALPTRLFLLLVTINCVVRQSCTNDFGIVGVMAKERERKLLFCFARACSTHAVWHIAPDKFQV